LYLIVFIGDICVIRGKKIMTDKKYTWHKIADHINELDFADNNIAVTELKGKKICIGKYNELVFAFAYKCPHAGGILADGYIDAIGNIVCPLHRYKYSLQNGRNVSGEGYYLKHYPVELREGGVFAGIEENSGLFGWLK
jgi:3-phenylpropionate/trans-cinnamate dioxygenase ferredoxin subunit